MKRIPFLMACAMLFTCAMPVSAAVPVFEASHETTHIPAGIDSTDDPAIWLHPDDPGRSLVLGVSKNKQVLNANYKLASLTEILAAFPMLEFEDFNYDPRKPFRQ